MRRLPSFAALRAFEAAARNGSFKAAAAELGLSPTAISHQIRQLEETCGRPLFYRHVRQVELSPEGAGLAQAVTGAFDTLDEAWLRLVEGADRASVTMAAGPIFASRWLVPRLVRLWRAHPHIDLVLHHSPLAVWRQASRFDLAVAWGKGDWEGFETAPLLRIRVSPMLAPALAAEAGSIVAPADLMRLPLLHHRDEAGWREWFAAAGVATPRPLGGMVFDDANVLLQATLSGRGASLGILEFVGDELLARRLCQPFALSTDPGDAYHLITGPRRTQRAEVADVRAWLLAESQAA